MPTRLFWPAVISAAIVILFSKECPGACREDSKKDFLYRLKETRFFIIHGGTNKSSYDFWAQSKKKCIKFGLKLAKIGDIQTDILVSRRLEEFMQNRAWPHNYFWLDARFDLDEEVYAWQDANETVKYSNFFFNFPRPKGYGDFYSKEGDYKAKGRMRNCLSIGMPLPYTALKPNSKENIFGHHTSWWEKQCFDKSQANTLCESDDEDCNKEPYYNMKVNSYNEKFDDLRPVSNRRFVISWNPLNFKDAKNFCKENKMNIYKPDLNDTCLIENLKNWNRHLTSYSFWIDASYIVGEKMFKFSNNKTVPMYWLNKTKKYKKTKGLFPNKNVKTCASVTYNFEQEPFNKNFCGKCIYNSLVNSPENCNNPIGVICQPDDYLERNCTVKYIATPVQYQIKFANATQMPALGEFFNFDELKDAEFRRSAFKQPGRWGLCLKGYTRVTEDDTYWGSVTDFSDSKFPYDWLAPYWLSPLPKNCQDKNCKICKLSRVIYNEDEKTLIQNVTEENCDAWLGFILCRKMNSNSANDIELKKHPPHPRASAVP